MLFHSAKNELLASEQTMMDNSGMAQIIPLARFKAERAVNACFRPWRRHFNQSFDARTRLGDFSDATLCCLAEPGEASTSLLYDLILCLLGCEPGVTFEDLPKASQLQVIDIHLFISDQIRFEMLCRLHWLSHLPADRYPMVDMVVHFEEVNTFCRQHLPILAADHPQYSEYRELVSRDQQVFIRRLLPGALEVFRKTILHPR